MVSVTDEGAFENRTCFNQSDMNSIWMRLIQENTPSNIDRAVTPLIYFVGFFGNIASINIWMHTRTRRDNSSSLYLVTLACTDLVFLCIHCFYSELYRAWGIPTRDFPVVCEIFAVLYIIPQYLSPLLVLGFTVERFVSITRPFHGERFARHNRTSKQIIFLVVFAVLQAMPQSYIWTYSGQFCIGRTNKFNDIWTWVTEILTFVVLPMVTLILNVLVLRVSRQVPMIRTECSLHNSKNKRNQRRRQNTVSTVTLLCVSFYRIFSLIPTTITFAIQGYMKVRSKLNCMSVAEIEMVSDVQAFLRYASARMIIEEVGLTHHACNVFIYCFTAKHFRKHLRSMICPFWCTGKAKADMTRKESTSEMVSGVASCRNSM